MHTSRKNNAQSSTVSAFVAFHKSTHVDGRGSLTAIFPGNHAATLYLSLKAYIPPDPTIRHCDEVSATMRSSATNVRLISIDRVATCSGDVSALLPWVLLSAPRDYSRKQAQDMVVASNQSSFDAKRSERWPQLGDAFFHGQHDIYGFVSHCVDSTVRYGRDALSERVKSSLQHPLSHYEPQDAIHLFQSILDECLLIEDFNRFIHGLSALLETNQSLLGAFESEESPSP